MCLGRKFGTRQGHSPYKYTTTVKLFMYLQQLAMESNGKETGRYAFVILYFGMETRWPKFRCDDINVN